jgi:hypothetical protein
MSKIFKYFFIFYFAFGCTYFDKNKVSECKEIKNSSFSFCKPEEWKFQQKTGIDNSYYILVTENNDTILFENGRYAENINLKKVLPPSAKGIDTTWNIESSIFRYSNTPSLDQALGVFMDEYFVNDTIENKVVKIQIPKESGNGITGLYHIPVNNGKKITIRGENLSKKDEKILLKIFKSLSFNN